MAHPAFKDVTLNPFTLRFKAKAVEDKFTDFYIKKSFIQLRIAFFFIFAFYIFFSIIFIADMGYESYNYLAIFLVIPAELLIFFLIHTKSLKSYSDLLIGFAMILYSFGSVLMIAYNQSGQETIFYVLILTVIIFRYVFLGIKITYAFSTGFLIFALASFILYTICSEMDIHMITVYTTILFVTNIMGLIACYFIEFFSRRDFYVSMMFEENKKILNDVNDILDNRVKRSTEKLERKNKELLAEIEERKNIEEKMNQSLKEKEVLLKEIHHRVKNNMQIISSLLLLQSRYSDDENVKTILLESQSRIESMALVHEKLYQSNSLSKIDFKDYVSSLIRNTLSLYSKGSYIEYAIDCEDDESLNISRAMPIGILITEFITNSLKHGFKNRNSGKIDISLRYLGDDKMRFILYNNGENFPKNIDIFDRNLKSYGLRLIVILTSQLDGKLTLDRENGTKFTIDFILG